MPDTVFPSSTVLRREEPSEGSSVLFFYDRDLSIPIESIDWKTSKALVPKSGLSRRITTNSVIEISGAVMDEFDRLWPHTNPR
jgi:hypothetical protein